MWRPKESRNNASALSRLRQGRNQIIGLIIVSQSGKKTARLFPTGLPVTAMDGGNADFAGSKNRPCNLPEYGTIARPVTSAVNYHQ